MHATSSKIITLRKLISAYGHIYRDVEVTIIGEKNAKLIACSVQCGRYIGTLPDGSGIKLAEQELVCVRQELEV